MAKSNIVNDDGIPVALLPSKSDSVYPVKKRKDTTPVKKQPDYRKRSKHSSTLSL